MSTMALILPETLPEEDRYEQLSPILSKARTNKHLLKMMNKIRDPLKIKAYLK